MSETSERVIPPRFTQPRYNSATEIKKCSRTLLCIFIQVSREKSEEANAADYHEWSINERLKPHPNVLQIVGLCPSFQHPDFTNIGTTALISPYQQNGDLRSFLKKGVYSVDTIFATRSQELCLSLVLKELKLTLRLFSKVFVQRRALCSNSPSRTSLRMLRFTCCLCARTCRFNTVFRFLVNWWAIVCVFVAFICSVLWITFVTSFAACNVNDEWQMANVAFGMIQGIRALHDQGVRSRESMFIPNFRTRSFNTPMREVNSYTPLLWVPDENKRDTASLKGFSMSRRTLPKRLSHGEVWRSRGKESITPMLNTIFRFRIIHKTHSVLLRRTWSFYGGAFMLRVEGGVRL